MIGLGCAAMGLGCVLIALPHFLMGRYQYESSASSSDNVSSSMAVCLANQSDMYQSSLLPSKECEEQEGSLMWVSVLIGNIIRGIGEAPIAPLGISYVEDFARAENSPFYIGCLQIATVLGPLLGLMIGSYCAQLYVDIGFINLDFVPYLKSLFHNRVYMLFHCITIFQFSAWIGMITFMPKYLEQQYGISASDAIFYIGVYNLPIICAGYFFGGLMMKKFKINIYQAAHVGFWSSLIEYLIYFSAFAMFCKNSSVAGLSVSYKGIEEVSYTDAYLYADCNRHCNCSTKTWDPVCGENGMTYVSSCLAGCGVSNGTGKNTVLTNCSCISAPGFLWGNGSALPGQCKREKTCDTMLHYFLILSLICCLIYSFGAMPGYMVLIRSLKPEEKSFGVGLHSLTERLFAGIPSPIYFGAMIDSTCLKWGTKPCGGIGACRMYDTDTYRWLYLGLPSALRGVSFIPCVFILLILRKNIKDQTKQDLELEAKEEEEESKETEQKDMAAFQKCTDPQQETVEITANENTDL
ncbi:PREDICTED: solute carrier organic anion transporter family member 1A2 isoform X2 [Thamnophis sirtalis]|uniref:Solute carrier organic anion transporter family member n=1 Tax=Thamnophis sirtalis TaxID=35019 RepID=A0A6I9Z2X0_9SAUR|nr:PREDICTED: solute carrier organic anion transporter family member 1A2 isoform X2 [Thamnophis sirtalis]